VDCGIVQASRCGSGDDAFNARRHTDPNPRRFSLAYGIAHPQFDILWQRSRDPQNRTVKGTAVSIRTAGVRMLKAVVATAERVLDLGEVQGVVPFHVGSGKKCTRSTTKVPFLCRIQKSAKHTGLLDAVQPPRAKDGATTLPRSCSCTIVSDRNLKQGTSTGASHYLDVVMSFFHILRMADRGHVARTALGRVPPRRSSLPCIENRVMGFAYIDRQVGRYRGHELLL
jgi:hypothetical protein